jgi:hypothetical protein
LKHGAVVVDRSAVEPILSHLDAHGGQWVVSARPTPDDVEAIAQRLAALLLRGA